MPEAAQASRRLTAFIGWLALAAVVILLDQWSKYVVVGHFLHGEQLSLTFFFDLVRSHNEGAAFGMLNKAGGWQRWLFGALAVGVSGWIIWELYRHTDRKLLSVALALVMGGALGNLVDRVRLGYVVDFLDFHWKEHHFPAFNLADSAITCGAALLLLEAYFDHRRAKTSQPAASGE